MNPRQFREHVIRPTLHHIGLWSEAAERLLLGTALVESGLLYLVQHGGGPALGVYQIEPPTHDWLILEWLANRSRTDLAATVLGLRAVYPPPHRQLVTNLAYATAVARLRYRVDPAPLPSAENIWGLAAYWKRVYNTAAGKGDPADFVRRLEPHL